MDLPRPASREVLVGHQRPRRRGDRIPPRTASPTVVEPARDELLDQLDIELAVSKAHLRSILDRYWDQEWRRANRRRTTPEDQLWRAATAVTEIETAIDEQSS